MDVSNNEAFSVYPGKTNNPGASKVEPSVDSMSPARSSSKMFLTSSNRHWICRHLLWARSASISVEAVPWAVHSLQHFASWLFLSANKSGPSTSNKSSAITIYSSATSDMLTTVSSSVTHVFVTSHHMKYCWMKASTGNQSSLKPNLTKSSRFHARN